MRPGLLRSCLAIAGSAVVVAALAACGGNPPPADSCTPKGGTSSGAAASQIVQVVPDPNTVGAYQPKAVTVKGGTLEWDFTDQGSQHSVTADDASFDSGLCNAGAKFLVTFSHDGTFNYHCTIHAAMTGTVTVS